MINSAMGVLKPVMLILLPVMIFTGCRNKKTRLADNDTVTIVDFVDFFPEVKLPFQINDSILNKKETDSVTIGNKIFSQFVPDSVLIKYFGKDSKPKIYPLGKVNLKKQETYLFMKAITPEKKIGYVLAFDKNNTFIAAMPVVIADKNPSTLQSGGMDTRYTVFETLETKNADEQFNEGKNVYILNPEARTFSLIMTDQVVADEEQEIINPIDTFQRKNKYAADYIKDKRNYISIRDGKNASTILFFIHFEKDDGDCTGELKGEAVLTGTRNALFRATGNPCVLEFTFTGNTVAMKELEACGSYRDIKCFFDGAYSKKKESKPKKK